MFRSSVLRLSVAAPLSLALFTACTDPSGQPAPGEPGWAGAVCRGELPAPPTAAVPAAGWNPQPPGADDSFTAVDFVNDRCGWAVGNFGLVMRTVDGGATWMAPPALTSDALRDFRFADSDHGWIVGGNGLVLRTDDGGESWAVQAYDVAHDLHDLAVVDAWTAYLAGSGRTGERGWVARTVDGGATWTRVLAVDGQVVRIAFADADHGWAAVAAAGGTVFHRTSDGGATGTEQPAPTGDDRPADLVAVDRLTAWAALRRYEDDAGARLAVTRDGGATWTVQVPADTAYALNAVTFVDAQHGWAVGAGGIVLATTDAGASWRVQKRGELETSAGGFTGRGQYVAVDFTDRARGWLVGWEGVVMATATSGW